jgi:AcrR family transcriptional regulator
VRRQQVAETRERIVGSGAELVHELPSWDWRELTVRAVANRAGVSERTVYRHFASERELRDAVMRRLEEEAGDPVGDLTLEGFEDVVTRLFAFLASFAATPRAPADPTFVAVDERRRQALLTALEPETDGWSEDDRRMLAAELDMMWSVAAYERMIAVWGLDPEQATQAVAGMVRLLVDAIREGRRPWLNR